MSNLKQRDLTTISLTEGGSLIVKDYRGFTVFQVDENGDVKRKGRDIKI